MSAVRRKTNKIGKSTESLKPGKARLKRSATAAQNFSYEAIAERAYYIWQSKGCPWGQSLEDWLEAEKQLEM